MSHNRKPTVGIMTFHWAPNYGAVLQAWALQEFLNQNHYQAEFINYVPRGKGVSLLRCFVTKSFKNVKTRLVEYIREKKIKSFRNNHMRISQCKYRHKDQLKKKPPIYDYYVSGSDQIWNPFFTMNGQNGITLSYYLDFVPPGRKKFAFATSFGSKRIPEEMRGAIKRELESYSVISVREENAIDILRDMGIGAECIADPTLLFSADEYKTLLPKKGGKRREVFQFMLHGQDAEGNAVAAQVAADKQLGVCHKKILSIEEWLEHIQRSEFVVTNSYHCVVFSLLFHTPFLALDVQGLDMSSRITTLLARLDLEERFLTAMPTEEVRRRFFEIDWKSIDSKLQENRQFSREYIIAALSGCGRVDDIPKSKCTGCGLCVTVCPNDCIRMLEDERGFVFPHIDKTVCVNCGLCFERCIVNQTNQVQSHKEPLSSHACWHKDPIVRKKSSSGGVFSALAEVIFEERGRVYGAKLFNGLHLAHVGAENNEDLAGLRGSKYMASNAYGVFHEIKQMLSNRRQVLFCGTPCQVAALKSFTGNPESLITVDVACHGIPSAKILADKCTAIEKRFGKKVERIDFRDKNTGWKSYSCSFYDQEEKEICSEPVSKCDYMMGYIDSLFIRESCERCVFAALPRAGDLTLADCWYKVHDGLDVEDKGISAVLINTAKGVVIFDKAQRKLQCEEVAFSDVVRGTPLLVRGSEPNKGKDVFWVKRKKHGFTKAMYIYRIKRRGMSAVKKLITKDGNGKV